MRGWTALLALGLGAACEPREVVVVDVPPLPDGGRPHHGPPCTSNADCPSNAYCEKLGCDEVFGRCRPRPVFCPPEPLAVCACNGVTYWNDCLRQRSGEMAASPGECTAGASCNASTGCPNPEAVCAFLLPTNHSCAPPLEGACWVPPDACPPSGPSQPRWIACGASACLDTCATLRAGLPARRALSCP